jgi:hypothetical protein
LDRDVAGIAFRSFFLEKINQINTVRVSNVSPRATEHDIQDFFSFSGEIEHVELHECVFFSPPSYLPDVPDVSSRRRGSIACLFA